MNLKHKQFVIQDFKMDDDSRTVEGWASTFGGVDSYGDTIAHGAFAESIKARKPKMLWQHDSRQVIGVWDSAVETDQGLYVKGAILGTQLGNDAYTLAKAGAIDSMSIGYAVKDASFDQKTGIRTLKKVDLWEVSLVTFPANQDATITRVKALGGEASELVERAIKELGEARLASLLESALSPAEAKTKPATERELEECLRDVGFSQMEAKKIVSEGFKAIAGQRDVEGHELEGLFQLLNHAN